MKSAERTRASFWVSVDGELHIKIWVAPFKSSRDRSNTSLGGSVWSTSHDGPPYRIHRRILCLIRPMNLHCCRCHGRMSISLHVRPWLKPPLRSCKHLIMCKFPSSSWAKSSCAASLRLGKLWGSTAREKK